MEKWISEQESDCKPAARFTFSSRVSRYVALFRSLLEEELIFFMFLSALLLPSKVCILYLFAFLYLHNLFFFSIEIELNL